MFCLNSQFNPWVYASSYQVFSPLIRRTNWISLGCTVIRFRMNSKEVGILQERDQIILCMQRGGQPEALLAHLNGHLVPLPTFPRLCRSAWGGFNWSDVGIGLPHLGAFVTAWYLIKFWLYEISFTSLQLQIVSIKITGLDTLDTQ